MAKTKPKDKKNKKSKKGSKDALHRTNGMSSTTNSTPSSLVAESRNFFQEAQLDNALESAKRALGLMDAESKEALPVIGLLGEIHVEMGDIETARQYFLLAAGIDEDGAFGAEKFLWLAQLSEEGGQDSVDWFEKGCLSLRVQIQALLEVKKRTVEQEEELEERRKQLASALCSVVEVYMTDLSWEEEAEKKCEALVTEATIVAEGFAEPWQTLANVRISQERLEDARAALKRSLDIWRDLPADHPVVPDYPTRVSLARLLMEADMDQEAIDVLETLVGENDASVEVWYLGGWGLYVMGMKQKTGEMKSQDGDGEGWRVSWISSRQWLTQSLTLFKQQDYEDERLGEHAKELLASLNAELGEVTGQEEEDEWEDAGDDEDEEMAES